MDSTMDRRVLRIYIRALELPETERQAFLVEACGQDEALAKRVYELLTASHKADEFFGSPPQGLRSRPPQ